MRYISLSPSINTRSLSWFGVSRPNSGRYAGASRLCGLRPAWQSLPVYGRTASLRGEQYGKDCAATRCAPLRFLAAPPSTVTQRLARRVWRQFADRFATGFDLPVVEAGPLSQHHIHTGGVCAPFGRTHNHPAGGAKERITPKNGSPRRRADGRRTNNPLCRGCPFRSQPRRSAAPLSPQGCGHTPRPSDGRGVILWQVEAAYGTERLDTLAACGDTDNGFG